MIHRAPKIVQLGLIIATIAVIGACSSASPGDSARPVPAWSPPNWMHGTWALTNQGGSIVMKASRYNVEVDMSAGGLSVDIDVASFQEQGLGTVRHSVGVSQQLGLRLYSVQLDDGTTTVTFTFFNESSSVTSLVMTTSTGTTGPSYLTKQT